jgi:AhpD family alkylhydroperoxidase
VFLHEIEENPQLGPYAVAIQAAEAASTDYWGIWNLLAFRTDAAIHLCILSHQIMFEESPISQVLCELIAAYKSSLNRCDFCRNAHAAVASHLYGSEEYVRRVA